MNQILKELLKPPFYSNNEGLVLNAGETILLKSYGTLPINYDYVEQFQAIAKFTANALNEKYERDFAEHKRWINMNGGAVCPKCREGFDYIPRLRYCPSCGTKLLPSEEATQ